MREQDLDADSDALADEEWWLDLTDKVRPRLFVLFQLVLVLATQALDEFEDVTISEKTLMKMFSRYVQRHPVYADYLFPATCVDFVLEAAPLIVAARLRTALLGHLLTMLTWGVIDRHCIAVCMAIVDHEARCADSDSATAAADSEADDVTMTAAGDEKKHAAGHGQQHRLQHQKQRPAFEVPAAARPVPGAPLSPTASFGSIGNTRPKQRSPQKRRKDSRDREGASTLPNLPAVSPSSSSSSSSSSSAPASAPAAPAPMDTSA